MKENILHMPLSKKRGGMGFTISFPSYKKLTIEDIQDIQDIMKLFNKTLENLKNNKKENICIKTN